MADNSVFITGAADGAFEKALGDLPPWATQNTAESIEGLLRKSLNIQTKALTELVKKATAGDKSPQAKKLNDELDKLVKNLKEENKQADKDKKYNKDRDKDANNQRGRWKKENDIFGWKVVAEAALLKSGLAIKDAFEKNVKTFDGLTASGINVMNGMGGVRDGFDSIRQLSAETGVRFSELSATMTKYSTTVNAFGFGKFAKTVGIASTNLTQFGFSSKETAELLGTYLESQKGFSDIRNKTEQETSQEVVAFGKRITDVSLATGQHRGKILENLDAISKSTKAAILTGQVGTAQSQVLQEFVASFKDQKLGNEVLAMMTDAIKPLNETFTHLQKSAGGAFGVAEMNLINKMKANGASAEEMQAGLAKFVQANEANINQMIQQNNLLEQAGNQDAKLANDHLNALKQQSRDYNMVSPANRKKIKDSNKASNDFQSAWEKLLSTAQKTFAPTIDILNSFTTGLTWVNDRVTDFGDGMKTVGDRLEAIAKSLGFNQKFDIAPLLGLVLATTAFAASLWGASKIIKSIFNIGSAAKAAKAGGGLAEAAAGAGGGRAGPSGLSKLGKGIGDLGKGLGKGIGGLLRETLTGLADGLKALGNPKALFGTVVLAAAGAATWVAGKAFQEFATVSWKDVLVGLGAIGGLALVAGALSFASPAMLIGAGAIAILAASMWGAGKAFQVFGEVNWTALSEGLGKFGTGLKILWNNSPTIVQMGLMAGAIAALGIAIVPFAATMGIISLAGAGITALSSTLTAFRGLDTLKTIVDTINKIDIAKALAFGAISALGGTVSLPTPKPTTGASPLSTPKASTLRSPSQVSTKEGTVGEQSIPKDPSKPLGAGKEKEAPEASINTALGYQSSILEQILLGQNALISVNKDILKYARVQT